jgi:hypothetical protein
MCLGTGNICNYTVLARGIDTGVLSAANVQALLKATPTAAAIIQAVATPVLPGGRQVLRYGMLVMTATAAENIKQVSQ